MVDGGARKIEVGRGWNASLPGLGVTDGWVGIEVFGRTDVDSLVGMIEVGRRKPAQGEDSVGVTDDLFF